MSTLQQLVSEVRINDRNTTYCLSDYNDSKGDSTPVIRYNVIPTSKFIERISDADPINSSTHIMPIGTRFHYVDRQTNYLHYVIELPPQVRTIRFNVRLDQYISNLKASGKWDTLGFDHNKFRSDETTMFRLAFPYIVFVMSVYIRGPKRFGFGGSHIYYRPAPLTSLADQLFHTNLYNVDSGDVICMGDVGSDLFPNPAAVVTESIMSFWCNAFNEDYTYQVGKYQETPIGNPFEWAHLTAKDPRLVLKIPMKETEKPLSLVIRDRIHPRAGIRTFSDMFTNPVNDPETENIGIMSESYSFNVETEDGLSSEMVTLSVGDKVILKKKPYYITTFWARPGHKATTIEMEDDEGNVEKRKITPKFISELSALRFKNDPPSVEIANGTVISRGDMVILTYPDGLCATVRRIRKSRDGEIEVNLDGQHYLASVIKGSIFDDSKAEICGFTVIKGEMYLFLMSYHYYGIQYDEPISECNEVRFNGLTPHGRAGRGMSSSSQLRFKWENVRTEYKFSSYKDNTRVLPLDYERLEPVPHQVIGTYLVRANREQNNIKEFKMIRGERLIVERFDDDGFTRLNPRHDHGFPLEIFHNDGDTIRMSCFTGDVEYNIGDYIVLSNWRHPEEMIKVRRITGFSVDEGPWISIDSVDEKGDEISTPILNYRTKRVNHLEVRRIIPEYMGIVAGMKFKSNVPGIQGFPKKDVNQVVGFLIDSGTVPLMLASNLNTVWAFEDEMAKFTFFDSSLKKFWDKPLAPIIEPTKLQDGDMVIHQNGSVMMCGRLYRRPRSKSLFRPLDSSRGVGSSYSLKNIRGRVGFLNPRISPSMAKNSENIALVGVAPNYLGGGCYLEKCVVQLLIDRRAVGYVQSNDQ